MFDNKAGGQVSPDCAVSSPGETNIAGCCHSARRKAKGVGHMQKGDLHAKVGQLGQSC